MYPWIVDYPTVEAGLLAGLRLRVMQQIDDTQSVEDTVTAPRVFVRSTGQQVPVEHDGSAWVISAPVAADLGDHIGVALPLPDGDESSPVFVPIR